MRLKIWLISLLFFLQLFAKSDNINNLCISLDKTNGSEIQRFMKMYNIPDKKVAEKILDRKTLFAQAYLKRYGLSPQERAFLSIFVKKYLANKYIQKILDANKPTKKEAYSYYLLHKKEFGNEPFAKIRKKVEKEMVLKKSLKLINQEYKRLKDE